MADMSTVVARAKRQVDDDHPLLTALARASVGKPFTPEQRTILNEQMKTIRKNRAKIVRDEDREHWLEAHAGELDDPDE